MSCALCRSNLPDYYSRPSLLSYVTKPVQRRMDQLLNPSMSKVWAMQQGGREFADFHIGCVRNQLGDDCTSQNGIVVDSDPQDIIFCDFHLENGKPVTIESWGNHFDQLAHYHFSRKVKPLSILLAGYLAYRKGESILGITGALTVANRVMKVPAVKKLFLSAYSKFYVWRNSIKV